MIHRAKIYLSQSKHDLSLNELSSLKNTINNMQYQDKKSLSVLADLYDLKAEVVICSNKNNFLDDFFGKYK